MAGWRDVPVAAELVADRTVGETPTIRQAIVVGDRRQTPLAFARRLAILRRAVEAEAAGHRGGVHRLITGGLQGPLRRR